MVSAPLQGKGPGSKVTRKSGCPCSLWTAWDRTRPRQSFHPEIKPIQVPARKVAKAETKVEIITHEYPRGFTPRGVYSHLSPGVESVYRTRSILYTEKPFIGNRRGKGRGRAGGGLRASLRVSRLGGAVTQGRVVLRDLGWKLALGRIYDIQPVLGLEPSVLIDLSALRHYLARH